MPRDTQGNYTRLSGYELGQIGSYIQGVIRREPHLNSLELAIRVGTRFDVDQSDTFQLYKLFKDERQAVAEGDALRGDPSLVPGLGDIPTLPGDPADTGRVVTNVVIVATNTATGDRQSSNEQIISDGPISASEIRDMVLSNPSEYIRNQNSLPAFNDFSGYDVEVVVLGVYIGG